MFDFSAIDVSATVGLTAMVLLTLNILMGLLVSVNYNSKKQWPHRKLPAPLFRIHNWTGYAALAVAALHPTILLFANTKVKFGSAICCCLCTRPIRPCTTALARSRSTGLRLWW